MIKSQIITAVLCLGVGFASAMVLFSDLSLFSAEAAQPQAQGGNQGQGNRQQGQQLAQGVAGHTHGPRPPQGSQGAKKIDKFMSVVSRELRLNKDERQALRFALRQQNFHVRQDLQQLQKTLVRYAHAPETEKATLRELVLADAERLMDTTDWGHKAIHSALDSQDQEAFRQSESDRSIYFHWLGE